MLRTGIYTLDQVEHLSVEAAQRRDIALWLYPDLVRSDDPRKHQIAEALLARLKMGNFTNKRTYSGRFAEFDSTVIEILRSGAQPGSAFPLLDVGVSDGRTSVEFFKRLSTLFGSRLSYTASDKYQVFRRVRPVGSKLQVILDADGAPCQLVRPPFVLNTFRPEHPILLPVNNLLRMIWKASASKMLKKPGLASEQTEIRVLGPEAQELIETDGRFNFDTADIMAPIAKTYRLVRAMNLLNRDYFGSDAMKTAITNLGNAIEPGGYFVVGSNEGPGSTVNGAIYLKSDLELQLVKSFGSGFESHDLVA